MPSLRDIKRRIKSVKNTQKITQAMRMVAAAKVKRAENRVKASRPFSAELSIAFQRLLATRPEIKEGKVKSSKAIDNYPALLKQRETRTVGLLVITSDKGLAGAYNANVVRKTILKIKELKAQGIGTKVFIVGQKGLNALKRANVSIAEIYTKMPAIPTAGQAGVIAEDIAEYFVREDIDKIEIITTHFKSMLSFEVQQWNILPVSIEKNLEEKPQAEMLFEPDAETILQEIVPLYFSNRVYQALIEASASELAARMSAMAAATSNAGDMIQHLTLAYNKARQASITQELLEVVSGADALKG